MSNLLNDQIKNQISCIWKDYVSEVLLTQTEFNPKANELIITRPSCIILLIEQMNTEQYNIDHK